MMVCSTEIQQVIEIYFLQFESIVYINTVSVIDLLIYSKCSFLSKMIF